MSISIDTKPKDKAEPPKHSFTSRIKQGAKASQPYFKALYVGHSVMKYFLPKNTIFPVFGTIGALISIFSVPSSLQEILKNAKKTDLKGSAYVEKNLHIASATANIACGILYCMKVTETIGIAILGFASHSMGAIRVAVTSLAPFAVPLAGIEIIKTAIDIGIDAVHIHQTNKKIKKLKEKTALWGSINWKDPSQAPIISAKIEHLKAKQITSREELAELEGAIKTSALAVNHYALKWEEKREKREAKKLALSQRNVIIRLFGKIVPNIKVMQAKSQYKIFLKKHTGNINQFNHLNEKYNRRTNKIKNWKIVEGKMKSKTISKKDHALLQKFQKDQINKWSIKKSNHKLERLKTGLGIALKTVVIISLVASIILTFTGYGTIPGIVTMITLTLFIAAAEYGLKKFKKHKKPTSWTTVQVPLLT